MTKTNPFTRWEKIGENTFVVVCATAVLSVAAFSLFGWPIISFINGAPWYEALAPWIGGALVFGILFGIERGYNWIVRKWDDAKYKWEQENADVC